MLRVPELVNDEVLEKSGAKKACDAFAHIPTVKLGDLVDADAISRKDIASIIAENMSEARKHYPETA